MWGAVGTRLQRSLDARIFALQAPLLLMRAECSHSPRGGTGALSHGGDASASAPPCDDLAAWRAAYSSIVRPVRRPPPWPLMLWPRPASNSSDTLLLRAQRSCGSSECGDVSVRGALERLLAPPWALRRLSEVGLTGGPLEPSQPDAPSPVSEDPQRALEATADEQLIVSDAALGGTQDDAHDGAEEASQNSDEAGVFVSDAALARPRRRRRSLKLPGRRRTLFASSGGGGKVASSDYDDDAALEVRAFHCELTQSGAPEDDAEETVGGEAVGEARASRSSLYRSIAMAFGNTPQAVDAPPLVEPPAPLIAPDGRGESPAASATTTPERARLERRDGRTFYVVRPQGASPQMLLAPPAVSALVLALIILGRRHVRDVCGGGEAHRRMSLHAA